MNTETKVTTGATETTYDIDIELPPLPDPIFISDHQGDGEYFEAEDMRDYARAAVEADRQRRGSIVNNASASSEPVNKGPWKAGVNRSDKRTFIESDDFTHDVRLYIDGDFADQDEKLAYAIGIADQLNAAPQPLNKSDIPAESVSRDVEALVRLLEDGEWAEHVARTPLGQRLELAITTLVGEASKPHNDPESKRDWNNELSSWGDEDFIHIFHERPDLANRLRKMLTEPVKCIGCEGKPAPENNPCAVCGKEAELVKPHLTVKYDDKGDYLYICCDSNEPAEAEENDQGILLWRAHSDGRLVGVTIPNFIGPYIKPVKEDAEALVLSDADVKHVQDFINCDGMGTVIVEGPQYSAVVRALLTRYTTR